jgi:DNA-binding MarR family transcriptional regulator
MTRHRVSPLDAHLGYWLRYVSNQVSHAFAQKVATHGVSVAEWVVLRELFDEPETTASQLADKLGMTRGAISKIVDRLEAKALMTRTADAADARFQTLALTAAGAALVPKLAGLADRNDEEFFGHLQAKERAHLQGIMQGIVRRSGVRKVPTE